MVTNKTETTMKNIIFSTMMACLLVFVGCQNEELVNDNSIDNGGEKVILTAIYKVRLIAAWH